DLIFSRGEPSGGFLPKSLRGSPPLFLSQRKQPLPETRKQLAALTKAANEAEAQASTPPNNDNNEAPLNRGPQQYKGGNAPQQRQNKNNNDITLTNRYETYLHPTPDGHHHLAMGRYRLRVAVVV
ncbi:hypothetical protein, partial [uncultured Muribaculum sp.]|uniref:hypothetical protein n=1 Tax=uncultured Muribaculum sp. TaxID=1918613 RepID=UPI00271212ED